MQNLDNKLLAAEGKTLPKQSAVSIVKELGIIGLYRGTAACLMRDVPFSAIYFPTYAAAKRELAPSNIELKPHHLLLAGAMAGTDVYILTCT
jgi:solute carrier family 25 aspartate/glutamate transporter 12/13